MSNSSPAPRPHEEDRQENRAIVDSFFDRMEVGFCDEWSGRPADEQFEQLRLQNQKITNEKNKYLTIFESLKDPVILIDESGKVENANHAALTLFAGAAAPGASYYGGARLPIDEILGAGSHRRARAGRREAAEHQRRPALVRHQDLAHARRQREISGRGGDSQRHQRASPCARGGRTRRPGQVGVPGDDEPRNPHADPRHPRNSPSF